MPLKITVIHVVVALIVVIAAGVFIPAYVAARHYRDEAHDYVKRNLSNLIPAHSHGNYDIDVHGPIFAFGTPQKTTFNGTSGRAFRGVYDYRTKRIESFSAMTHKGAGYDGDKVVLYSDSEGMRTKGGEFSSVPKPVWFDVDTSLQR